MKSKGYLLLLITAILFFLLLLVGCAAKMYTLKCGKHLSPTQVMFKESPEDILQFIRLSEVKDPDKAEHWEFLNSNVVNDTTYFKILNTFETQLKELNSGKLLNFRAENYLDGRFIGSDSGIVIEAIKVIHSNNEIPSGYYLADIGRYVFGGIRAKRDTIINPEAVFKDFIILLDKTITKHRSVMKNDKKTDLYPKLPSIADKMLMQRKLEFMRAIENRISKIENQIILAYNLLIKFKR